LALNIKKNKIPVSVLQARKGEHHPAATRIALHDEGDDDEGDDDDKAMTKATTMMMAMRGIREKAWQ